MDLLQNKGVQMVLMNLIKAAAPDLVKTVDEIAEIVRQFKIQQDRIEMLLNQHLGDYDGKGRRTGQFQGNSGPLNGAGKQTGE